MRHFPPPAGSVFTQVKQGLPREFLATLLNIFIVVLIKVKMPPQLFMFSAFTEYILVPLVGSAKLEIENTLKSLLLVEENIFNRVIYQSIHLKFIA